MIYFIAQKGEPATIVKRGLCQAVTEKIQVHLDAAAAIQIKSRIVLFKTILKMKLRSRFYLLQDSISV